jgi:hypothetical protein
MHQQHFDGQEKIVVLMASLGLYSLGMQVLRGERQLE